MVIDKEQRPIKWKNQSNNVLEQDLHVTYNIAKDLPYPMDKKDGVEKANSSLINIVNNTNNTTTSNNKKYTLVLDINKTLGFNSTEKGIKLRNLSSKRELHKNNNQSTQKN